MINVIEKLRNGDADIFDRMIPNDQKTTLLIIKSLPDGIDIFNNLLPKLMLKLDNISLIKIIYDIPSLEEYLVYMISNYKSPQNIDIEIISYVIENTSWGFNYLLANFKFLFEKIDYDCITKYLKSNFQAVEFFRETILKNLYELESKPLIELIVYLIALGIYFDEYFIGMLLTTKYAFNFANRLLFRLNYPKSEDKKIIKKVYFENFDIIFKTSLNKIEMMATTPESFPSKMLIKYKSFIKIYNITPYHLQQKIDFVLSTLIDQDLDINLLNEIDTNNDDEITYLNNGENSGVFKIRNKVLKLGKNRLIWDTETDFWGIISSKRQIIQNEKGENIAIIEWQNYVKTNSEEITEGLIYLLLLEFQKVGLEICDSLCLKFKTTNFGILASYKDANTSDPESLPEWFKKTPLVLIDVDAVIKKGHEDLITFYMPREMDEAIEDYQEQLKKGLN